MRKIDIHIAKDLLGKVKISWFTAEGIAVDDGAMLWSEAFEPLCKSISDRYRGETISKVEGISSARDLYKAIGVDPTRNRPSSEALIRRLIKDKDLYHVNSLVDTVNYCSLSFLLPMGLYDLDMLEDESIRLRQGVSGEGYKGISKEWVNVEGRYCLADNEGPFGSPTADSLRTSIRDATRKALVVIYAPASIDSTQLEKHTTFSAEKIRSYGGGTPKTDPQVLAG